MAQRVTFICDYCDQNEIIEQWQDGPPLWVGANLIFCNSQGFFPNHEEGIINNFCSLECLQKYLKGEDVKRRLAMVDVEDEHDGDDDMGDATDDD